MTKPAANSSPHAGCLEFPRTDIAAPALALLSQLESSLQSSHRALLACDLVQLDEFTRQQSGLLRAILELCQQGDGSIAMPRSLRPAQIRVLHLARVQRGLLTRLNRRAAMLSHLSAGTRADYSFATPYSAISLRPIPAAVQKA